MSRVLVTGADGYLGSRVVARCVQEDRPVTAWIHAQNPVEYKLRSHQLRHRMDGDLVCLGGDLADPRAFERVMPDQVSAIVHAAAVTRFDVDMGTAQKINVAGTERLARLAACCPKLERLVMMGSAYAAGLLQGDIEEAPLHPPGFANHYEWSKWRAEKILEENYRDLPWTVVRAATVVADDETGACGQLNVVHDTLRLLYRGLLSVMPGNASVPVPLVTADTVTAVVMEILSGSFAGRFVNACPPVEVTPTLGSLLGIAMATFETCPDFRQRRVRTPPFCGREAFQLLVDGLNRHGGDLSTQVSGSLAPFAAQLFIHKRFVARRMAQLVHRPFPDPESLLRRVCERMLAEGLCGTRGPARATA
jgi:nucleoside-diphosphate-sugar epimerase